MAHRHNNALYIQQGACNPSGIVHTLLEAVTEAAAENRDSMTQRQDPAVRLMLHQLCHLYGITVVDQAPDGGGADFFDYDRDYLACVNSAHVYTLEALKLQHHHRFLGKQTPSPAPIRQLPPANTPLEIPPPPA